MPQFDPSVFAPQLIWLIVSLVVLYFILSRSALPRIGGVLQQRQNQIANDLDKAREFREESEIALADYERALAEARAEAQAVATETRERIASEAAAAETEADERMASLLREAEERIATMRENALAQVDDAASETALALTERLIGSSDKGAIGRALKAL